MKNRTMKSGPNREGRRLASGFTVVELLVAAAITLVLLGLMVQITFSTLQTFDRVTGSLNSQAQARIIFDYLRRDFGAIVWKPDGKVWLLATVQDDQTTINGGQGDANVGDADWSPTNPKPGSALPSTATSSLRLQKLAAPQKASDRWMDLSEYRFGQAGVWLRFFTKQPTNDVSEPSPIAVAYQIIRMKPQSQGTVREMRYLLFRSAVRPGPTKDTNLSVLTAGFTDPNAQGNSANATEGCFDLTDETALGYNTPNNNNGADKNSGNGAPGAIRRPDRELILGNNIVDFGVRFWRRELISVGGREVVENKLIFPANRFNLPANENLGFAITSRLPDEVKFAGVNQATRTINNRTGASSIPFASNFPNDAALNTSGETGATGTDPVGYPDYVEVMVRILTDEGARILAAFENGDIVAPSASGAAPTQAEKDAYWWTITEQNSVVYTDTIPLPSRPF